MLRYHIFTASHRVKKMLREHRLFQCCPVMAVDYQSAGMGEWENGKRWENSPDQTFPEPKQQHGVVPAAATPYRVWPLNVKKKKNSLKRAYQELRMLSGTENTVTVLPRLKYRCQSCDSIDTAVGGNSFCTTHGLQPVSSGHVMGGSLAETWVQGIPSPLGAEHPSAPPAQLCAWPRSEPAWGTALASKYPAKASQFTSNFHGFCFLLPDQFPGRGHNAMHNCGTEAAAWEQEQTERGDGGISMTSWNYHQTGQEIGSQDREGPAAEAPCRREHPGVFIWGCRSNPKLHEQGKHRPSGQASWAATSGPRGCSPTETHPQSTNVLPPPPWSRSGKGIFFFFKAVTFCIWHVCKGYSLAVL